MQKFTKGRTIGIMVVIAAVLAFGVTWVVANQDDSDSTKQGQVALTAEEQAAAREQAIRDADAKSAELVAENQANAQEANEGHAERFCAGEIGAPWLEVPGVLREAKKLCPDTVRKAKADAKKRDARDAREDNVTSDSGTSPPRGNTEGYCNARYEALTQGNGPGSNFDDYTDEDLAQAEAEYNTYCQGYEAPDYDLGG